MPDGVFLGYAFKYQLSEDTGLPHCLQIRCWKCGAFDSPSNHSLLTCARRRIQVIHKQNRLGHYTLPPISHTQRASHYLDFAGVFLAVLALLDVHPYVRPVIPSPYPVQDSDISSTSSEGQLVSPTG